jgi:hypothetical protein
MPTLTPEQQSQARQWIADGMKLSEFQKRIESDFSVKLTYMEVRMLVDDLKVIPKDPEPPKAPTPPPTPTAPTTALADTAAPAPVPGGALEPDDILPPPGGGLVKVTVDVVTRPGALVSGRVVFSDGKGAAWLVDQYGRPGLVADEKGYRPSPADLAEFQGALEQELMKQGF